MRKIGLHLRLTTSLSDLLIEAAALQLPLFQCFFINQDGYFINISSEEKEAVRVAVQQFDLRVLHASYWSNLASIRHTRHRVLLKELSMARELGFTHIIMHPGSAKGARRQEEGITALARTMNAITKNNDDLKIVLENTAHGSMSVGGKLQDFYELLQKVEHPEKIFFCIDTAHAYSYGYNITDPEKREAFIQELQTTISLEKIVLLHLNDTYDRLGSKLDRHAVLGEGLIGEEPLKKIVLDPRLVHIPILMEPPAIPQEKQKALLAKVREWHV